MQAARQEMSERDAFGSMLKACEMTILNQGPTAPSK
jgi:hypothetical protein